MQIKDYLNELLKLLAANPYIKSQNLSFEERPPNAAYFIGTLIFINDSKMYFKEFVVFKPESVNIVKYGYSYLSKDNTLIFRYDNALDPQAKKLSTYPGHKHTHKELLSALKPAFDQLLREISKLIEIEK
ncbi:MAG: hypothetical protein HY756_07280 [Nitrospirae bacterium]|nr:hypothetical protein [Nitrospirota bacterium]